MFADVFFLAVLGALVLAVVQLYGGRGSGIAARPYHHVHGGAPGAAAGARVVARRERDVVRWSRGTR